MYSESDLAAAVDAGILSPAAANAFRDHVAATRAAPAVDEESFRLLTGFNDIFVAIAAGLILVAVGWIGHVVGLQLSAAPLHTPRSEGIGAAFAGFAVAGTSWVLAEYFTRRRRMALPSILLLLGFAGGFFAGIGGLMIAAMPWLADLLNATGPGGEQRLANALAALTALVTAGAAWLHWRRFMVPITVAIGAIALVAVVLGLTMAGFPDARQAFLPMLLVGGLLVFALAMRWDMSDRERRTRRADVAFWLHLGAAPLIAHPVFHMLGVFDGALAAPVAVLVLVLYVAFALVALAIDRRALLVSSLVYVLWAMYALFQQSGAIELAAAFTALVIGSALLSLSAFWQPMRRMVVGLLGSFARNLPPAQQGAMA